MTEILTESFCERCGTRYTFESARPRVRLKGVKVLSRGLKNFVLSDGSTMDEAMASARSETDRELTAHQLDAFHKTFNFCMSCRQYTCPDCWNEVEARCLTCAPHLGHEILPAPFPDLAAPGFLAASTLDVAGANGSNGSNGADGSNGLAAHPGSDAAAAAAFDPIETDDGAIDAAARLEAMTGAASAPDPSRPGSAWVRPETAKPIESAPRLDIGEKTAAQTGGLLKRFRPGQSLDAELEAYERQAAATLDAVDTSPGQAEAEAPLPKDFNAPEADAEAIAELETFGDADLRTPAEMVAEPEAVVAEPEAVVAEPEAVVAEPEATPDPTPIRDVVPQPTWQMIAPDMAPAAPTEPEATIPAAATAASTGEPQWPARPEWLGGAPSTGLPFLNRPATPQGGIDALWAESTREVVTAPALAGKPAVGGVQPCISCGLSLSATARFCRRCGTPQAS